MRSNATTVAQYIKEGDATQKPYVVKLRKVINDNIPKGFVEEMNYGMIGRVVPHKLYPAGYRTDPKLPLPFICLAYQKNMISFYHMAISADLKLLTRFQKERAKRSTRKLDMGKGCIRLKHYADIPYDLLGELVEKMSVKKRIEIYEKAIKR